ncbi:5-oxoprolinase subunit PxpB [Fusibacter bizertensis]|uniref:5-oxoprolinase subunit PxpB n=1 Tax=Fusibacter bizertensis TaxID=1488331 RepID=A0ABT6NAW3_9FIRM|nr:5-oxoprolinase subunit PxpB [Fusibacter bizertensis]MDH8677557.1 5-oxoprolinase subunit PxpB [Fusibacter bizertensis]
MTYVTLNDRTLGIYFDQKISRHINLTVITLCHELEVLKVEGIKAIQHTYHMIAVHYDPYIIDESNLKEIIANISLDVSLEDSKSEVVRIPVLYDGPDLDQVSIAHNLTIDEVINIHSGVQYYVYFLGFSAGFPYLGGLDPQIATPRLKTPRLKVKAGSVGIADQQTGIYTVDSPGGWNIIGRTPLKLFDPSKDQSCILRAGCNIEFYPIDVHTFNMLESGDAND